MRLCDMPVPTPPNPDIFTSTVKGQREIVLLVAPPGTGKSTLARRFQGYTIVNQDTLKTLEKCKQRAQDALVSQRVSVVVDNTNMEQKTRQEWITLAQRLQVTIRAVQLQTPDLSHMKCLCTSLAEYRQFSPLTPPHDVRDIPSIVFNTYFPTKSTPTKTWPSETSETHPNPSLPSLPQSLTLSFLILSPFFSLRYPFLTTFSPLSFPLLSQRRLGLSALTRSIGVPRHLTAMPVRSRHSHINCLPCTIQHPIDCVD